MRWIGIIGGRRVPLAAFVVVGLVVLATTGAKAQSSADESKPSEARVAAPNGQETVRTFFLSNASAPSDFNDIQTALRNVLPREKVYGLQEKDAITIMATPEDMEIAQKLISDLDKPQKLYRVTYTITEIDGGKRLGSQQFSLLVRSGSRSTFKQGSRVPIMTGTLAGEPAGTQMQYQDVGLSIQADLSATADTISLRTKIEQSSLADEKSAVSPQDPIVRQTVLDGSSNLSEGKPMVLGSLDVPGTTRSQEIAVVAASVE